MTRIVRHPQKTLSVVGVSLGILAAVGMRILSDCAWPWAWWTGFSVITLLAYGMDKWQSKGQNAQRIPELALHVLALAGGVAGAWIGRFVFRHKTRRIAFTVVILLATLLHLSVWFFIVRTA